ncbi:lytic transglycosylase domain-containing protein [Nevskia soli]|uniref:lytic transglycosylase domain-containing protein n=1 Tax=Nevskia soli TaxID=418856 RepID=UPI000A05B04E|nr:lytic transglycosylase domain-containing protein [Nevskia soli]
MRLKRAPLLLVPALLCAALLARADDDAYAAARQEFLRAYTPASAMLPEGPAQDSAALQAYPLYPYLEAARLRRDLRLAPDPNAVDVRIAAFIKDNADQQAARALRRAWLPDLARRKSWSMFNTHYVDTGSDPALRCNALQARIALNLTKDLAPAIVEQWLTGRDTPAECEPAFDWLRARKLLPPSLIDQRARLALATGNARLAQNLLKTLPAEMAAPLRQWAALIEQPQREIDRLIAGPELPVETAALLDGWQRLARADVDAALQRYQPLVDARKLDAAGASIAARSLALGAAWSRRPEALTYFSRVAPGDIDERTAEWNVRAALWSGDWTRTAQALATLSPAQRELPRWRYWSARASEVQGDAAAARAVYVQLTANDNYYAVLSSARLGQPFAPHPQPLAINTAIGTQIAQQPPFVRAHELLLCDLKSLAAVEWQVGLEGLDPAWRVQAVPLALRWGWYEQAIASASKQGVYNDYQLLYPKPYDVAVHAAVALTQVPEDLIYAILRQESLYDAEVVSRAGAMGLLQLIPDTAQRVARRWQRPSPARGQLFDPNVNVPLGSAELHDLLELFGNQQPLAIAAYNAGPNAATRWLPDAPRDAAVWIENIPYNETRDYVQRVLWHSVVFGWRRSGEPQKADAWLGQIAVPAVPPAQTQAPVLADPVAPDPAPPK